MSKSVVVFLFFCACILSAIQCQSMTFEEAMYFYQKQDYEKAYSGFRELSALGNPTAQMNIGVMYYKGEYVEKDIKLAWAWAALAGDSDELSKKTAEAIGKKMKPDEMKEAKVIKDKLQAEPGRGIFVNSVAKDIQAARPILLRSPKYPKSMARQAKAGVVDIQFTIDELGAPEFFTVFGQAEKGFIDASMEALKGSKFEPQRIGGRAVPWTIRQRFVFMIKGEKIKIDVLQQYLNDLKIRAEAGGTEDLFNYAFQLDGLYSATSFYEGVDTIAWDNANEWLLKAARNGSVIAQFQLGNNRLVGRQCDISFDLGLFWLKKASDGGILDAKWMLGNEYLNGVSTQRNLAKAFELIDETAEKGLNHAQVQAAWLHSTIRDLEYRDVVKARRFLQSVGPDYVDERSFVEALAALEITEKNWESAKMQLKRLSKINKKYEQNTVRESLLRRAVESKSDLYVDL